VNNQRPRRADFFFFVPGGLARSIFRFYIRNLIINYRSINNDTHEYNTQNTKTKDEYIDIINTFLGCATIAFYSSKRIRKMKDDAGR
jgi:hypothetical protein